MKQPLIALCTALCLLVGTLPIQAAPVLVCRISGLPMEAVAEKEAGGSCCGVKVAAVSNHGTPRYALATPGCCDLRQAPERVEQPAVATTLVDTTVVATLPVVSALLTPPLGEVVPLPPVVRESIPRGPPRSSVSSRAPPTLS